jgi:hypothetical protein
MLTHIFMLEKVVNPMPKKRSKQDMKISGLKRNRVKGIPVVIKDVPQPGITHKEFMDVLAKTIPPVSESDSGKSQT